MKTALRLQQLEGDIPCERQPSAAWKRYDPKEETPEPRERSLGQGFNPPEPLERDEDVFPMQKDVFLADMSWDLISQIQRDENLARRWHDYAAQRFPT